MTDAFMRAPAVVFVTDASVDLALTVAIVRAAAAGLPPARLLVQLRDKENGPVIIRTAAQALRAVTREVGALFVVNGASTIAHEVGADGVHLPSDRAGALPSRVSAARRLLGDDILVTAAAHDDDEVRAAVEAGVTGVLVSPIFPTPGKGAARGIAAIVSGRLIAESAPVGRRPGVLALGGVNATNVGSCAEAGASGVAVIRAFYDAGVSGSGAVARDLWAPFAARGVAR